MKRKTLYDLCPFLDDNTTIMNVSRHPNGSLNNITILKRYNAETCAHLNLASFEVERLFEALKEVFPKDIDPK